MAASASGWDAANEGLPMVSFQRHTAEDLESFLTRLAAVSGGVDESSLAGLREATLYQLVVGLFRLGQEAGDGWAGGLTPAGFAPQWTQDDDGARLEWWRRLLQGLRTELRWRDGRGMGANRLGAV